MPVSPSVVPVVLGVLMLYFLGRATLEFVMQSDEVRRWRLAQFDFKFLFFSTHIALALLATSTFVRSLLTFVLVLGVAISLIVVFALVVYVLLMVFMAIFSRRGSVAGAAIRSTEWTLFIAVIVLLVSFILFAVFAPESEVFSGFATTVFSSVYASIVAALLLVSFYFNSLILRKIFAHVPRFKTKRAVSSSGFHIESISENPEWIKLYGEEQISTSSSMMQGNEIAESPGDFAI
jgi:hypothetical protein